MSLPTECFCACTRGRNLGSPAEVSCTGGAPPTDDPGDGKPRVGELVGTVPGVSERVVLIRHGETMWSLQRRHTGRTDIPLNDEGCRLAVGAGADVARRSTGIATAHVLTSPLQRARQTCDLAGLGARAEVCEDLLEWDYGIYEGRRTSDVQATDPGWTVWTGPITGGESLAEVGARADRVIAQVAALDGLTVLVAHAHLLRILAARWCGLAPIGGRDPHAGPGQHLRPRPRTGHAGSSSAGTWPRRRSTNTSPARPGQPLPFPG